MHKQFVCPLLTIELLVAVSSAQQPNGGTFRSRVPFNITTGEDTNGDTLFTERLAFATDLNRQCNLGTATNSIVRSCVVQTKYGSFDLQPVAG